MNELSKNWLKFAKEDLKTARLVYKDQDCMTNIVAFHVQQCIEKSMKAIILEKDNECPRIHDLLKLYGLIKNRITFKFDIKIMEKINEVYTDTRYPTGIGILPDGTPNKETANEFLNFAETFYSNIEKIIK